MRQMLLSLSRNPIRKRPPDNQIAFQDLPVKKRQLQPKLKEHTKGGAMYKAAFVKKIISAKNHAVALNMGLNTSTSLSLVSSIISYILTNHTSIHLPSSRPCAALYT
ncbi:hypothetical protein BJ878DRAFT_546808 [Calycina marina]|uniref:Uncharacterized protein n=1 Tax=Calycina marina TaxID=1763456 RepID=A0A9P7YVD9_9HELO|nr:hypothetical protein BJ878DRAFT_546808 [Calycina marina]